MYIRLIREVIVGQGHKTIFSIVNEPSSRPDTDDSLESMLDPEEDVRCRRRRRHHQRLFLRAASESDRSGGGTEDDPVDPVTLSSGDPTTPRHSTKKKRETSLSGRFITISSGSTDLNDGAEKRVDPTPILPAPPIIQILERREKQEADTYACSVPSSVAEGMQEDWPRRVPQMTTARGRMEEGCRAVALRALLRLILGLLNLTTPTGSIFRRAMCSVLL